MSRTSHGVHAIAIARRKARVDKIRAWRYAITIPATHLARFPVSPSFRFWCPHFFLSLSLVSLMHCVRATKVRQIVFRIVNETNLIYIVKCNIFISDLLLCIAYDEFGIIFVWMFSEILNFYIDLFLIIIAFFLLNI